MRSFVTTLQLAVAAAALFVATPIVNADCDLAGGVVDPVLMYVGGYSRNEGWVNGKSKGIYTFAFFPNNGTLVQRNVLEAGINPTFVRGTKRVSGKKQFLYAVNEAADASKDVPGTTTGYVASFEVSTTGQLKLLNRRETRGAAPAHVSVSPEEDYVAVSLYGGGGVVLYPINADGSLGAPTDSHFYTGGSNVVPASQNAPHLHSTTWVPGTSLVLAADLGNDQIVQFKLDRSSKKFNSGSLPIVKRPPGSGPRHMDIHPNGNIAYVVDELSNTIGVYQLNAQDKSLPSQATQVISTLPVGNTKASSSADIHGSGDGRFVYSSNRGHDSIAIFRVTSQTTGALQFVGTQSIRGTVPRSFLLYKNYLIVAGQNSDTIEVFLRNDDGTLTNTGITASSPTPVSLFIPAV